MPQAALTLLARRLRRLTEPAVSDAHLIEDYRRHQDEAAFAALVARHAPLVMGVCRRALRQDHDAEDAFKATFLVLARNAGRVRRPESLAAYLHGVATRVARNARRTLAKQRQKDRRGARPEAVADDELSWREVRALLDEEVERLPEAYRRVFVLCCLQEVGKPEAAKLLGLKEGTVSSRLARAKAQLQERLGRRGVTLSVLLATLGLGSTRVSAAALKAAAGVAGGAIPAWVAELADGIGSPVLPAKVKVVALALLAGALLTPLVAQGPKRAASEDKKEEKRGEMVVARVVDPDGKPVAGAKVYRVVSKMWGAALYPPSIVAESDKDGQVRMTPAAAPTAHPEVKFAWLAVADGFGTAILPVDGPPDKERELRLVKDDVPVVGRIVNLEGKPLRGVTVRPFLVRVTEKVNLTPWLTALARDPQSDIMGHFPNGVRGEPDVPGLPATLTTDADGRFRLNGVGRERLVGVTICGPSVECDSFLVITRPGGTLRITDPFLGGSWAHNVYPATFQHAAGPPRPVIGTVRDAKTGKPIAGATVDAGVDHDTGGPTRTAKDGTFRVDSLSADFLRQSPSPETQISVKPPPDEPYMPSKKWVQLGRRDEPLRVDFVLAPGLWAEGRVTDRRTGKGVRASVDYYPATKNPNATEFLDQTRSHQVRGANYTEDDGSFRVPILPGKGAIMVRAEGDYLPDETTSYESLKEISLHPASAIGRFNAIRLVDVKPAEGLKVSLAVDPGHAVVCKLVDPDGRPVRDAHVRNLDRHDIWTRSPVTGTEVTVQAMSAKRPSRWVFAIQQARQIGGAVKVSVADKGPVELRLVPTATITGRLVDADGNPRKRQTLHVPFELPEGINTGGSHLPDTVRTDEDGRFRGPNVLPGMVYQIGTFAPGFVVIKAGLVLKSGEAKDLGNTTVPRD